MSNPVILKETPIFTLNSSRPDKNYAQKQYQVVDFKLLGPFGVLLICGLFLLPLFFGGRSELANSFIKSLFFLTCTIYLSLVLFKYPKKLSLILNLKILGMSLPFLGFLVLQCIPIPLSILELFSMQTGIAYSKTSSNFGYLSIDPQVTLKGFIWFLAFILLYAFLINRPYRARIIRGVRHSKNSKKTVLLSPTAREYDYLSEILQVSLIRVTVFCALIGVTHLALQSKSLFGIFSFEFDYFPSSRAHWPFVNANQLAVMLESGLLLSFSRFLREMHLRKLTLSSSSDHSFVKNILHFLAAIEKQTKSLLVMFILALALILTMSRAGMFLSFIGMTLIWLAYRYYPVFMLPANQRRRMTFSSKNFQKKSVFVNILAPGIVFISLLIFLGDEAMYDLSGRVSETYTEGGSASRWELNQLTKDIFYNNLLFGVGLNSWDLVAYGYMRESQAGWMLNYAHNDYLQLLSEIGLVGSVSLLIPLFFSLKKVLTAFEWSSINPVKKVFIIGLFVSCLIPMLHAAVDFPYHLPLLSLNIFTAFLILSRAIRYQMTEVSLIENKSEND